MDKSPAQKRTGFFYIKKITGLALLLLTAAVFLFSGISKLYAFESFIWNIMDAGISNLTLASVAARIFIGIEMMLGLFLLFHLFLRSFTYPAILCTLAVFSAYLILLLIRQGDSGNCGCFGDAYEMKPSAAIGKNIVLIGVTGLLYAWYPVKPYKNGVWLATITGMGSLVAPFLFFPLNNDTEPGESARPIDLSPLYHSANPLNLPPEAELRKGKHIIAFMSLTCTHCRKAAFFLQVVHRQNPDIPIFFVLNGHPDQMQPFWEETHAAKVPHILFRGAEFQEMSGPGVPAIYYIHNSVIERKANYFQLDPQHMRKWLHE